MPLIDQNVTLDNLLHPSWVADHLVAAGMSAHEAAAKGERFEQVARLLVQGRDSERTPAVACFVPGRIEVLGKHTDYCGGRSLLCTVERGMCFIAMPRGDSQIRFFAADRQDAASFALDPNLLPPPHHWSNYAITVARRVARNFPTAAIGADIAVSSDLPAAAGLSSSSAMIVGIFMLLAKLNRLAADPLYQHHVRSREGLAAYLGCIENGQSFGGLTGDRGVGTFGGSQDHTAILCCKPGMLSAYSFCPVTHERDMPLPGNLRFLTADSGVVAEKTGDAMARYNRVAERARRLVTLWNASGRAPITCLRDAVAAGPGAVATLRSIAEAADPELALPSRLGQFLAESNALVPAAIEAIAQQDWDGFSRTVNESQRLAEVGLQNQVDATTALQRRLLISGALAASAFGAGFGGSVWGLFPEDMIDAATAHLSVGNRQPFATRPGCPVIEFGL